MMRYSHNPKKRGISGRRSPLKPRKGKDPYHLGADLKIFIFFDLRF
jgi:hypothetical protein